MDLFDFLDICWLKYKRVTSEENQPDDIYMAVKWLSLAGPLVTEISRVSRLQLKLPKWAVACLLYHVVPKLNRAPRNRYPNNPNKKPRSLSEKAYRVLQNAFNCRQHHVDQIKLILESQGKPLDSVFGQMLYRKE